MRLILFFKKMVSGKEGRVARFAGLMALLAGLSLVYGRNLLKYSYHFGLYDWNFFLYQHQYWHISLFSFKQLPLWNPYACGGMSFIGRPDVSVLPFPIIFVTAFGALAGLRIMAVFYIFLGMTGMFYVCRYLKIGILPSLIAGVIFSMNGALALRIMAGHLGWLSVAYLPFIVLFYLKGLKKFRYLFLCSLFLAFVAAEGSYILMFTAVFLFVFSALYALQQKSLRPLLALGLTLALCVLLSGPKLFPMIEMMSQFPRGTDVGKAIPLKNLYNIFWERNQLGNLAFAFMRPLNWWEFGSYIGIVPVVIFVLSFKLVRRQWPLLLTAVCVFVIGLGNFSALAPWTLLHRAPVFCNMHISSRVWVIFLF
ncbi:MAG TPA: hypothetical protein P5246_05010, partial [Candidatus Omnitrophota bacterium]|nr:hypothetical protein [Candidatus Omnitrophota bacterium]